MEWERIRSFSWLWVRHVNRLRECEFQLCDPSRERRRGERFEELKFYVAILVGSIRVCELQFVIAKEWET